jgi:hypothetical protein
MLKNLGRWTPVTGVVFAVLLFLGGMVGGNTPDADASPQKVVAYYQSHHGSQQASVFLIVYATVFGLFFAAALHSYLRARSDEDALSTLGRVGMTVLAVAAATVVGINFAATDVTSKISPISMQTINVLQNDVFFGLLVGTGIFLIGNGLAIVRSATAVFPRWIGWAAIVFGVAAMTPIGWLSLIFALPIFSLIVSVLMFLRQAAPTPAVTAAAAG